MRSLADQPVAHLLPVVNDGIPCNDPAKPYWGNYSGDENTRRKPAYHNGTAWCLQMPLYCEALFMTYGESAKEAAGAILGTAAYLMGSCCIGHLPEIIDGSTPHTPRGCSAQAWSVTECRRVLKMLK
jgi:glycogen debranching enzyme